ncbi:MAG: hypothetical protein ACO3GH_06055 [Ilumatobacteraceae bacterium]
MMSVVFSSTLTELLNGFAWVVIIGNAMAGLWALAAHKLPSFRMRAMWWFTVLAQFTMFVQVALGVAMVNVENQMFPQFHAFYGFVGIIAIAIIYSYRAQLKSRVYLLYGFGGLFIMGLGIRAMLVGQG